MWQNISYVLVEIYNLVISIYALQIYLGVGLVILTYIWIRNLIVWFFPIIKSWALKIKTKGLNYGYKIYSDEVPINLEQSLSEGGEIKSDEESSSPTTENQNPASPSVDDIQPIEVYSANSSKEKLVNKLNFPKIKAVPNFFKWNLISGILIISSLGGILIPTPKIIYPTPPLKEPIDINEDNPLEIEFDRPVNEDLLWATLSPSTAGQWIYENKKYGFGLIENLTDNIMFYPTDELSSGEEYIVNIEDIQNKLAFSKKESYLFVFTSSGAVPSPTPTPTKVKAPSGPQETKKLVPVSFSPASGAVNVNVNQPLEIVFNQIPDFQSVSKNLITNPSSKGEFVWEVDDGTESQKATLLYKPDGGWEYDTYYQVNLNPGIRVLDGPIMDRVYQFTFTTVPLQFELEVPLYKQKHKFTCYSAAAQMALGYYDVNLSPEQIRSEIGFDVTDRNYITNKWGDPNKGIVGSIDGTGSGGYGAHWGPVAAMISNHRTAEVKRNWNVNAMLEEVKAGHPVMVWWVNGVWPARELFWKNADGEQVRAVNGMHVEVVRGWIGDQANPDFILTNDPWRGERKYPLQSFLSLWKWFENTAVVVK